MALVPPSSCPPFFPASPPSIDSFSSSPLPSPAPLLPIPRACEEFSRRKKKERKKSFPPSLRPKKEGRKENGKCPLRRGGGEEEKLFGHERTLFPPLQTTFTQTFLCVAHGRSSPLLSGVRRARPPPPRVPPPKFLHVSPSSASRPIRHTYVASLVGRSEPTRKQILQYVDPIDASSIYLYSFRVVDRAARAAVIGI